MILSFNSSLFVILSFNSSLFVILSSKCHFTFSYQPYLFRQANLILSSTVLSLSPVVLSSISFLFIICYYNYSDRHSLLDHFIIQIYNGRHVMSGHFKLDHYIYFSNSNPTFILFLCLFHYLSCLCSHSLASWEY